MAGLSHLRDVYEKRGKDFLENLLNKTVIINEKIEGAYFGAKRDASTNKFNFFKKDSKISYIDRVLSKYYESGVKHFENLGSDTINALPENYVFGFDYAPGRENPLTISHVKVLDENYQTTNVIHDREELNKWASSLNVNQPAILFQGKLSDDQQIKIQEFIFTPLEKLSEKFKTESFTKHIISILSPVVDENSQNSIDDRSIDEVVFRFYDEGPAIDDSAILAKLVDPVFYDNSKNLPKPQVSKKSDDYIWIIVSDLMNFIESYRLSELRSFTITGETVEERFISLINHIFVEFIKEYGDKYSDLDIQIPEFLTRQEFDVNSDLANDQRVAELITKNLNYKEIYRVFINTFRKKKIKINSPLFTESMKANLISQIEKLNQVAMGDQLFENYFPSFNEFVGDEKNPGYFETYDLQQGEQRKVKKVNVLLSEFQPIHKGHVKTAKLLNEKTGVPTLFVCIHPGKQNKRFPFKKETLTNALNKVASTDSQIIVGNVIISDGNIESILKSIKPQYEPLSIAAEPSRIKDIALQLELAKKRSRNLNIKRDTKLIEIPADSVSETVLNSIKEKNYGTYKEYTPSSVHSEFYNLNKDLMESITESINHSNVTTDEPSESYPEPIIHIED
jgi:hypothetical protein